MLICLYRALTSENPTQQHFPLTEEAFTTLHPPLAQKGIIIEELGCSPITSRLPLLNSWRWLTSLFFKMISGRNKIPE